MMAAACARARYFSKGFFLQIRKLPHLSSSRSISFSAPNYSGYERWRRPFLQSVKKRLKRQAFEYGPESTDPKPRSWFINWNRDAEIYSFGKRLGEDFDAELLDRAFTHESWVIEQEAERKEVGLEADGGEATGIHGNSDLIERGQELISSYVKAFLRYALPKMPEEGIECLCDHLSREETLCHVATNMGCRDLVLTKEHPVSATTLSLTFPALVAALDLSRGGGRRRSELLVQDFLLTQLIEVDVNDVYEPSEPLDILSQILTAHGYPQPEPRIIGETGKNFIMACYTVGIYCNKQLLGEGAGETISIARNMAARRVLSKLWGTTLCMDTFKFGVRERQVKDTENPRLSEWMQPNRVPLALSS